MQVNSWLKAMSVDYPSCPFPGTIRNSMLFGEHVCPVECAAKLLLFLCVSTIILYVPLGRFTYCESDCAPKSRLLTVWDDNSSAMCCLCDLYKTISHIGHAFAETCDQILIFLLNSLYEGKLQFYRLLGSLDNRDLCRSVCCDDIDLCCRCSKDKACKYRPLIGDSTMKGLMVALIYICYSVLLLTEAKDNKEEVDKVIEDEITQKLSDDLLQSLERKFQVDLQKSVDMVLLKIKLLLKNGTLHIQDRLGELQETIDVIKSHGEKELEVCLQQKQNETSGLAEKALHQMVVCGYALIGHDPAQAVHSVLALKNMIRLGIKPIYEQKNEVYGLLKVCGHDHDTLKKVIKCVISKSPIIKSAMMDVTSKLIDGVVSLTKLMAHGAMHEACLIEVIRNIEDEAFTLVEDVRVCVYNNNTFMQDIKDYIKENNATVLDIPRKEKVKKEETSVKTETVDKVKSVTLEKEGDAKHMKDLIRRMLTDNKVQNIDSTFKEKLVKLQQDLTAVDANEIVKKVKGD